MRIKSILLSVLLAVCVSWLPAYQPFQRSHLVETNAMILLRISNGGAFMKALKGSSYGKLWNSPEMKPFLNGGSLEEALIKGLFLPNTEPSALDEAYFLNRQILSMFNGEVILGIELGLGENETKLFFLVEMNEPDYKKIRVLFEQENKLSGDKTVTHRHTFQGVELIQDVITGDDQKETHEWMAFSGNTFINGSSRQWVEQCIVRLQKKTPGKPEGLPSLQFWLPDGAIQRLFKTMEKEAAEDPETPENTAPDTMALFKAMGIDALGKVSLEWKMTAFGSELDIRVRNKADARGIWTLFSKDPAPRGPVLGYVPGDVLSFQVARVNVRAFWEEIPVMLQAFGPEASARFKMFLAYGAQMLQVDIERDIVANLDTVVTSYSRLEGTGNNTLTAWQLRDAAAIEKALGKMFAEGSWLRTMMKENLEALDLQEYKVYSVKIPKMEMPADGDQVDQASAKPVIKYIPYGITVVEGDLIIGQLGMVRSFINGLPDKKAGRKFYKSRLYTFMDRRVPDNAIGYSLSDINQLLKPGLDYFKKIGQNAGTPPTPAEPRELPHGHPEAEETPDHMNEFFRNLKFDRLPAPEFLASFFGPWISYYQFDGNQISSKWEFHNPGKNSKK